MLLLWIIELVFYSNINRLKSENRLLREKLNLIRNESEIDPTTNCVKETEPNVVLSPRTPLKPPLMLRDHATEMMNPLPSARQHSLSNNEDSTLPSRYVVGKYTTDRRTPSPTTGDRAYTSSSLSSKRDRDIESIMKRYSEPSSPASAPISVPRRSRSSRPNSYHESYGGESL